MNQGDQNFLQVMATVLIGTFITYAVDLRGAGGDLREPSTLSPGLRGLYRACTLLISTIPVLVLIALVTVMLCVFLNWLPVLAKAEILFAGMWSVAALGGGAIGERIVAWLTRSGR